CVPNIYILMEFFPLVDHIIIVIVDRFVRVELSMQTAAAIHAEWVIRKGWLALRTVECKCEVVVVVGIVVTPSGMTLNGHGKPVDVAGKFSIVVRQRLKYLTQVFSRTFDIHTVREVSLVCAVSKARVLIEVQIMTRAEVMTLGGVWRD